MTTFRLLGGALLLSWPLLGHAQTTGPAPRYYVGLAAHSGDFQRLGGTAYGGAVVPVQLTLGYQLQPRLAVQLSLTYSGNSYNYSYLGQYYYPTPTRTSPYYFSSSAHGVARRVSVGLLARYTLTRQLAHRVQFDALGGLTLDHASERTTSTRTDTDSLQAILSTASYEERYNTNNYLLTGGLSTRCRLGQRLEAMLDITLSRSLLRGQYSGFPGSTALGLRYRFGQR